MSLSMIEYLQHIFDECEYLVEHTQELSYDEFMEDATLQYAALKLSVRRRSRYRTI